MAILEKAQGMVVFEGIRARAGGVEITARSLVYRYVLAMVVCGSSVVYIPVLATLLLRVTQRRKLC